MQPSSAKPSSASPSDRAVAPRDPTSPVAGLAVRRGAAVVGLLAVAVWLGGLLALGAIAAPVVFSIVPMPWSADAMTVVFRRFDVVSVGSALVLLVAEAASFLSRARFAAVDRWRVIAGACACALAVVEAVALSPRIAALHAAGALRGAGPDGLELARLHDLAEACGKGELLLLVGVVVLYVASLAGGGAGAARGGERGTPPLVG